MQISFGLFQVAPMIHKLGYIVYVIIYQDSNSSVVVWKSKCNVWGNTSLGPKNNPSDLSVEKLIGYKC